MRYSTDQPDRTQPEIIETLRNVGCSVANTTGAVSSEPGFPDIVVGHMKPCSKCGHIARANTLVEVKDGELKPSRQRLNKKQRRFHAGWRGPIEVVNSIEAALKAVGIKG